MAKTGTFQIHEKGYPTRFHNTEIPYQQGETIEEIVSMGHAESAAAVVRAFYGQFNIRASGQIKVAAAKPETTVETLAGILQGYKVLTEKQTAGGNPDALAKAREAREVQKAKAARVDELDKQIAENPEVAKQVAKLRAMGVAI